MSLPSGTRLGPYEILESIGAGGMGEVYRARDKRLDRDVAIKVLPESLATDPDALARFEREAKAIAALSHPNILAIHDFGTMYETAYAVTELLEGETLRSKLQAPIPERQALDYARQIVQGLSAAHEKGVVHRDLKPDNLFITRDGHLKILDFGLAKRVRAPDPDRENLTEPGAVMGTAGYMSPEQVKGLPIDHRSDIFSFGTILYEMLSGNKAFKRDSSAETIAATLKEEPPELAESGRNIAPALDQIVRRCLEKNRDRRFQSVRDIALALSPPPEATESGRDVSLLLSPLPPTTDAPPADKKNGRRRLLIAGAAISAAMIAGGLVVWSSRHKADEAPGSRRVAVLPFENLGSPADDYFADGIADEIRSKLTVVPGIEVIARGSSTPYRKTTKTPTEIARELEAGYLLTATVRWQKTGGTSRVHVTPELVEVKKSGLSATKWEQPFDAALTDVFQVQSDIASRVAQALGVALGTGTERRLLEKPTQNLPAYDAFLKAEQAWNGGAAIDPPSLRRAIGFAEQAVALDPGFAQAWATLSRANSSLYAASVPSPATAERARQAAEKAVALAPNRPEGYLALGTFHDFVHQNFAQSLEQYSRGLRLAPSNADLLAATALAEEGLGRWDGAVSHLRQAERLDPRSVNDQAVLSGALLRLRRYPEAREALNRGLALAPASLILIERKAMLSLAQGDLAGARAVLQDRQKDVEPTALVAYVANFQDLVWTLDEGQREVLVRLTPSAFDDNRGGWSLCLVQAYALNGDRASVLKYAGEAREAFEDQLRATPADAQRHANLGLALAYLGRKDEAMQEGRRALTLRPVATDAYKGPYIQHQVVRIFILVGEPERALDQLEPLLKIPYYLSPGWLKIDPTFDPIRRNPRFQKLVAGTK